MRVITRLNLGGPATHVVVADRGLSELGWETLLVHGVVDSDEAEIEVADIGIPMTRLRHLRRAINPARDAAAFADIALLIRRYRPDIIHTHLSKAGLLGRTAGMAVSRAARVHTFHGTLFGGYFGWGATAMILRTERFLGRHTDWVLALSERQRQELLQHQITSPERIQIVPLGMNLDRFTGDRNAARQRLRILPDTTVIVAVGRLVPIKRLDRLLRVFAGLHTGHPEARLYLVGDGPARSALEDQVARMGLSGTVTFVGWSRDPADWYAAADLVVLTSDSEGTPLALIEAAAAARPVVATDVGGVTDVVREGETGFVVGRLDEAAFVDRMATLVADASLRARLGDAARLAAPQYAAARLVTDLDRLYRDLLRTRRRMPD